VDEARPDLLQKVRLRDHFLIMNEPMPAHIRKVGAQATLDLWVKLRDLIHREHPGVPVAILGNTAMYRLGGPQTYSTSMPITLTTTSPKGPTSRTAIPTRTVS